MTPEQRHLAEVLTEYMEHHGPLKTALLVAELSREEFPGNWVIRYEADGKIIIEKVSKT